MNPEAIRKQIEARLARPTMLDPRAISALLSMPFRSSPAQGVSAFFAGSTETPSYQLSSDGVAVVSIEGALSQRAWSCWGYGGDGYDAITSRCRAALQDASCMALLLRIDSPGGEVAGCFEAVRQIRELAAAAGKPVVAYADELTASAAYALACAADRIVLPDSGCVGSIGVITTVLDQSEALAANGYKVHVITSGARKADGHSAIPLSEDAHAAIQAEIDYLAREVFAPEVAGARGMSVNKVMGLEAACFLGPHAVSAGLADQVGNFSAAMHVAKDLARERGKKKQMEKIKLALGLNADATDDQVQNALDARLALAAVGGQLGENAEVAQGALSALREEAGATAGLREQLAVSQRSEAALEKGKLLSAAVREGKLTRDDVDGKTDRLRALLGAEVADVSVDRIKGVLSGLRAHGVHVNATPQPVSGSAAKSTELSAEEKAEAAKYGISEKSYLASKQSNTAADAAEQE